MLFTSHVNDDHLYEITSSHIPVINKTNNVMKPPSPSMNAKDATLEDTSGETANWAPDAETVERHALAVEAYTYGAYYFTAECQTLRDFRRG